MVCSELALGIGQWSSIGGTWAASGPPAAYLWPPNCYSCVLVGSACVYRDLFPCQQFTDSWVTHCCEHNFHSFLEQFAYLHFAGCRSKFTAKRKADSENWPFEEECTETFAFILPPTNTLVLNMPGDYSCDEDFPFETAL